MILILRIRIDLHHNLENGRATDDEDEQRQQHRADWRLVLIGWQLYFNNLKNNI